MKKLCELYEGEDSRLIKAIKINSKEVEPGDLFLCTKGVTKDRHDFIDEAIQRGASAVVVSREVGKKTVPIIRVPDTNQELPLLARRFYDFPDQKLKMIGVTGTNGKTTVAEMVAQLFGSSCAYLGTNGIRCSKFHEKIRNTTPDADRLYSYMDRFVKAGCDTLCMEASSEAFFRHRLDLISYDIAVLTQITQDHLNIHKTLENYIDCKCQLFRQVKKEGVAILNSKDVHFEQVKACCNCRVLTYGYKKEDDLCITSIQEQQEGLVMEFLYQGKSYSLKSPFGGAFNAENLAAAILVLIASSYSMESLLQKIPKMNVIEGRMEHLDFGQNFTILLDYAHTKDALDSILTYLNQIQLGRILTVTGSAGGREKEKRSAMGKVVLEKSDFVFFTMDDPRWEDVDEIINQMIGTSKRKNYMKIIDRKEAIRTALKNAKENDIVLIAGKGRDTYMAVKEEYLPYCDYDVVREYFEKEKEK